MKIIDLLNKIANGEEVPKKIKYCMILFNFDDGDYLSVGNSEYYIPDDTSIFKWVFGQKLNDEVEIIEEDKKIEPFDMFDNFTGFSYGNVPLELRKDLENNFQKLNEVISELINEVNELKKGK